MLSHSTGVCGCVYGVAQGLHGFLFPLLTRCHLGGEGGIAGLQVSDGVLFCANWQGASRQSRCWREQLSCRDPVFSARTRLPPAGAAAGRGGIPAPAAPAASCANLRWGAPPLPWRQRERPWNLFCLLHTTKRERERESDRGKRERETGDVVHYMADKNNNPKSQSKIGAPFFECARK